LSYFAGSSVTLLRDCLLQNCASELAIYSKVLKPKFKHCGHGTQHVISET